MPVKFDAPLDAHVCSTHGVLYCAGVLECPQCGGDGLIDEYEDDPINYSEGESFRRCSECNGRGGWKVCPVCCADNPDVEW